MILMIGAGWTQKGLKYVLLFVGIFGLVSYIVMYLWNWLLPELIDASSIGFWQAAGLLLLSRILFGGLGKGKKNWSKGSVHWKEKMQNKWANMTEEEKLQFKEKMEQYCPSSWKEESQLPEQGKKEESSSS
ncbi:MAG TPA: hypothetical protein DCS15_06240 [Flavobacteriales bacterium]|nr:hypothetical protein [Salibacteraceae bacterium]HAS36067.1 hypothetical protein [Flavobacteriales bacterium]